MPPPILSRTRDSQIRPILFAGIGRLPYPPQTENGETDVHDEEDKRPPQTPEPDFLIPKSVTLLGIVALGLFFAWDKCLDYIQVFVVSIAR